MRRACSGVMCSRAKAARRFSCAVGASAVVHGVGHGPHEIAEQEDGTAGKFRQQPRGGADQGGLDGAYESSSRGVWQWANSSYSGGMADTLTSILKKLLNQPTAPFHEYHVRAQIEQFLLDVPHVELSNDGFGNLIATYRKGKRKPNPAWVLGAHMDHPAWVKTPGKGGEWEFLGGIPKSVVETKQAQSQKKEQGDMAPVELPRHLRGRQSVRRRL